MGSHRVYRERNYAFGQHVLTLRTRAALTQIALAAQIGLSEARRIVEAACDQARTAGGSLQQAAHDDPRIRAAMSPEVIDRALDPAAYLGSADTLIDRALAAYRAAVGRGA